MQILRILAAIGLVVPLAGCFESDLERGVAGAAAGALIADATDNNVATGAVIGAAAGVFCDDLNVPGCVNR
ncbi:MAG: hypothetical protein OEM24_04250 [Paracoccaceae bacterium]|nr:hypothetical protein [Paracoccaceae bacterium]